MSSCGRALGGALGVGIVFFLDYLDNTVNSAGEIQKILAQLSQRGIAILITDHAVVETLRISDRAYILHNGVMLMEGVPAEIVAHEDVRRVYLGERFSL